MKILPCLLVALFMVGCSSDDSSNGSVSSGESKNAMNNEAPLASSSNSGISLGKITDEQRDAADRILQFGNLATGVLTDGYYALPDALFANVNRYLDSWRLPKQPRVYGAEQARASMRPPEGIFNENEEAILTRALREMDAALGSMLKHYAALEKYVADDKIRDNGKEGKRLGKKIAENHTQFMKARKTWLEMMDNRAEKAQTILLAEHPLERQIMGAGKMFVIFREISSQLALENPDKTALKALRQNLDQVRTNAEKPPFPASPQLERAYRGFLKKVANYIESLDAGLQEGFFNPQKMALSADVIECRKAYNSFAKLANQFPVSSR